MGAQRARPRHIGESEHNGAMLTIAAERQELLLGLTENAQLRNAVAQMTNKIEELEKTIEARGDIIAKREKTIEELEVKVKESE